MKMLLFILIYLASIIPLKLFSQSTVIWDKSYGGSDNDFGNKIVKCSDGNILIVGKHESIDGDVGSAISSSGIGDFWLIKIDTNGIIIWEKSFGGVYDETGISISETFDHGFVVAGQSDIDDGQVTGSLWDGDYWIVKMDSSGNFMWAKCFGSLGTDLVSEIHETRDSGIIVSGTIQGNGGNIINWYGSNDFWIIKLKANGGLMWQRTIGGVGGDFCNSVKQLSDGNFLVSGSVAGNSNFPGNHGSDDCVVIKLDTVGNILWKKSYGGSGSDYGAIVLPDANSGFYLASSTLSNDGDVSNPHGVPDFWIIHCDSNGNIISSKCYGTIGSDELYDAKITSDNGIIAVGSTNNCSGKDYYVVKIDSNQNLEWSSCYGGSNNEIAHSVLEVSPGKYIITGITNSHDGDVSFNHDSTTNTNDIWTLMLDDSPLKVPEIGYNFVDKLNIIQQNNLLHVGYNCLLSGENEITIYNINGQLCNQTVIVCDKGYNSVNILLNGLSGCYYLRLSNNKDAVSKAFYWNE